MKTTVLYLDHAGKLGGAEFALARLLRAIDRTKINPIVLFAEGGQAPSLVRECDVETHVLPLDVKIRNVRKDSLGASAIMNPGRAAGLVGYAASVAAFAKRRDVQIIHTNSLKAHIYGGLAGQMAQIPVVWHIRDFVNPTYLPPAAVKTIRFLARVVPSYVVGVSQSVVNQLDLPRHGVAPVANFDSSVPPESGNGTRSAVVHDGLGEEEIGDGKMASRHAGWDSTVRIGIVGRLTPWKGQHVFLRAAAKLLNAGFRAKFMIIGASLFGEKNYEQELHQLAHSLGIEEHVEFLGFRNDIPKVMQELDILVHASTSADPCPNTILEGMAHCLPIVASNGGGVPELVMNGETGLLAEMGDSDSMASSVETLLRNAEYAHELGRAGYQRVRRHFTSARVARQIEDVYRKVAALDDIAAPQLEKRPSWFARAFSPTT